MNSSSVSVPSNGVVDPVLARYHAIKRQMEDEAAAGGTPGGARAALTPRRASGTPGTGGSQYVSLYAAPLTPDASFMQLGSALRAASHYDPSAVAAAARRAATPNRADGMPPPPAAPSLAVGPSQQDGSILRRRPPGAVSASLGGTASIFGSASGAAAGASSAALMGGANLQQRVAQLERTLAERNAELARVEQAAHDQASNAAREAERRVQREAEDVRRALAAERDRLRDKSNALELRLQTETAAAATAEQQLDQLRRDAERAGEVSRALENDLGTRNQQVTQLRERVMSLERRLLDAEQEAEAAGGTRLLAGKVTALEQLVAATQMEAEQLRQHNKALEARLADALPLADAHSRAIALKDRELGDLQVQLAQHRKARERAEAHAGQLEQAVRETEERMQELDAKMRSAADHVERTEQAHKEELRARQKELHRVELALCEAQEAAKTAENQAVLAAREATQAHDDATSAAREAKAWQARHEAATAEVAQLHAAREAAVGEMDKLRRDMQDLQEELREQARHCEAQERLLREADTDREMRAALEAQVRVLQASFARQDEDAAALRAQHETLIRRIAVAEEAAARTATVERRLVEVEAQAEQRAELVERTRAREDTLRAELEVAREQHDVLRGEGEQAKRDFVAAHERCLQLQHDIVELDAQLNELHAVHGQLSSLNAVVEDRQGQIGRLRLEVQSWQTRARELDAEVEGLRPLVHEARKLDAELQQTRDAAERRDEQCHLLERRLAAATAAIKDKDEDAAARDQARATLEAEVARLQQQLVDKAQLDSRLKAAYNELQLRQEEISRERQRVTELQAKGREREEQAALDRTKRMDAEHQLQQLQLDLARLQGDLGKASVRAEAAERERARLERDAVDVHAALEAKLQQVAALERAADLRAEDSSKRQQEHTTVAQDLELASLRIRELTTQVSVARRDADDAKAQAQRALEERRELAVKAEQAAHAMERLVELEAALASRGEELADATETIAQLRTKVRESHSESAAYRKAEQRAAELRVQLEKQNAAIEAYEREESLRAQRLVEKERELGRMRERAAQATADLEAERLRRTRAEAQQHDAAEATERAMRLEGQLAGVQQVLQQRTRDLDEARAAAGDLRERLRQAGVQALHSSAVIGATDGGSPGRRAPSLSSAVGQHLSTVSTAAATFADLEARLRTQDETIQRLESEERRRRGLVEQLREELTRTDAARATLERQAAESQVRADRAEAALRSKPARLESDLADARAIQQQLQLQLQRATTDADALMTGRTRLTEEVTRLRSNLDAADSHRRGVERQLEQRNAELTVAVNNVTDLERRMRSASAVAPAAGAHQNRTTGVSVTAMGVSLSPELQQRRDHRKQLAGADEAVSPDARAAAALERYTLAGYASPAAV